MNMQKLLKQAQKMQQDLAKAQEEIAKMVVEASAGGGAVSVQMQGDYELKQLSISPDLLKDDPEMVEDLVVAAINQAVRSVREQSNEKMSSVSGGMPGLPGMF